MAPIVAALESARLNSGFYGFVWWSKKSTVVQNTNFWQFHGEDHAWTDAATTFADFLID
jgi:hypothetical protein